MNLCRRFILFNHHLLKVDKKVRLEVTNKKLLLYESTGNIRFQLQNIFVYPVFSNIIIYLFILILFIPSQYTKRW